MRIAPCRIIAAHQFYIRLIVIMQAVACSIAADWSCVVAAEYFRVRLLIYGAYLCGYRQATAVEAVAADIIQGSIILFAPELMPNMLMFQGTSAC